MPPFSTPRDLPDQIAPPQEDWLGLEATPGEVTIPVHFTVLRNLLDEQEIAAAHAWARDHRDDFLEETLVAATGEPAEAAQTMRVLDDLGDFGPRIAARTLERLPATRAYMQAAESVSLRIVEARPGMAIDVWPPTSGSGVGIVLFLGTTDVAGAPLVDIYEGRATAGITLAHAGSTNPVSVAAEANAAVIFPAQLTAVPRLPEPIQPRRAPKPSEPPETTQESQETVLVIVGHLGSE
jgi:hypothetical protein